MSGFLPDIASWALRGGASAAGAGNANDGDVDQEAPTTAISEEEVRAKRMARLAAFENPPAQEVAASASGDCAGGGGEAGAAAARAPQLAAARAISIWARTMCRPP